MTHDLPALDELLSHRPVGRVLEAGELHDEFALIRRAWEATGKPAPGPEDFAAVGRGSGTHLLKLVSPRAPVGQSVLRVRRAGINDHPHLVPLVDAKKARVAKIAFRPLEIAGHPPRHLADHILNPDDISSAVTAAFADAFGQDALDALRAALEAPPPPVTRLPVAEFPVIFLPRPGGGDLQATPLAPAEAYVRFGEVTAPYFHKRDTDRPAPLRGRWHRQHVSDKPQNISGAVGKRRTRFLATMPRVFGGWEAELHLYARGGPFPRWRDAAVADAVAAYAELLDRRAEYSSSDIRAGLDRRADSLIRAARDFVAEAMADARTTAEARLPHPPPVADVILRRHWTGDGFHRARLALTSDHFRMRLRASEA